MYLGEIISTNNMLTVLWLKENDLNTKTHPIHFCLDYRFLVGAMVFCELQRKKTFICGR